MRWVWKSFIWVFAVICMCGQMSLYTLADEMDGLPDDAGDMRTEYVDLSDMIIQAGGYSAPSVNYMISTYGVSARDQLKAEIYQALKESTLILDISSYGLTYGDYEQLENLFVEILNEHPELFYVEPYFWYSYNNDDIIETMSFEMWIYTDEEKQLYEDAVKCALSEIREGMTDEEKALVLHDYLAQNCAYAYKEYLEGAIPSNAYKAYGVFVDKRAVCNGYALAYSDLLKAVGINNYVCVSWDMNHAWNIILIDGEWYHVDVTWDDPAWNKEGRVRHEYFLLSDEEISNREHYGWEAFVECTSTKYDADDCWWRSIDSQIYIVGDKAYFIEDNSNSFGFQLVEKVGDSTNSKYVNNTYWEVEGGFGGWWIGAFSYLSVQNDYLYFNDKLNIYAIPVSGGSPQVIYSYSGGDGYIYGAMVYEDGMARLNIAKGPNEDTDAYITIDLRAVAPVPDVNYEAKTISTTAAMVYSADGGNTWEACTADMGLTEFGWTETKNKTVLFKVPAAGGLFESEVTEVTIKALPGITAGNLNCFGDTTGTVTIQMIDANGSVAATTTVAGDSTEYGMGPVNAGNYTMRISKENYVTREYAVSVGDEALTMDIEIHLIGDISGDGTINARDKKMMYNHISGSGLLENYDLQVGDVSGDGTINARDKKMLYNHIAGISNLWE